jgi:hypothetical protein
MTTTIARFAAAFVTLGTSLALGAQPAAAGGRLDPPGHRDANHCANGAGTDVNALFGVSEQILNPYCRSATSGEHWRPSGIWVVSPTNDSFPAGYVAAGATPIDDFVSKLAAVKVVIDGGTRQERTLVFGPQEVLRTDVTFDRLEPGAPEWPMAVTLPRMAPLSRGEHTREVIWVFSAEHCDGLAPNRDENCLPAGETSFGVRPLTVTTPT